jgi:hypothetical protein
MGLAIGALCIWHYYLVGHNILPIYEYLSTITYRSLQHRPLSSSTTTTMTKVYVNHKVRYSSTCTTLGLWKTLSDSFILENNSKYDNLLNPYILTFYLVLGIPSFILSLYHPRYKNKNKFLMVYNSNMNNRERAAYLKNVKSFTCYLNQGKEHMLFHSKKVKILRISKTFRL